MPEERDHEQIDAHPTKDFFIEMLVKDIPLTRAVIDLVDNCVDGAIRLRPARDFTGLWVRLEATPQHLRVADNCGGIRVDTARSYAFRFGRHEEMEPTKHSIGQFGVGMKRAFFKLGTKFRVESTTETSRFVVEEDVDVWRSHDNWTFDFEELNEQLDPRPEPDERGTIITVTGLHEVVSKRFSRDNSLKELEQELSRAHQLNMSGGLSVTFNRIPVQVRPLELLHSDQLKPAKRELTFHEDSPPPVRVITYAGLSDSVPDDGGWYVFCNGRMVLEADQTITTGWGDTGEKAIPKYHNQYARFRGYTFLDSDDASLLPWNTTKTGVDADSPTFQALRLQMIMLMRPVITFLNRLKDERAAAREDERDATPLERAVQGADSAPLTRVSTAERFQSPKPQPVPKPPRTGVISYRKPIDQIRRAKRALKARSNKAVGEKTFDYFFEMECED